MAGLSSFHLPFSRFAKAALPLSGGISVCKWGTPRSASATRWYAKSSSISPAESSHSSLERYKDLQRYFNRRIRATYRRFSDIPDNSLVYGLHHVYCVEGDRIYRMDRRQSKFEPEPEQVLCLGQCSTGENQRHQKEEMKEKEEEWTIQRVRLSPQEKHLAATLKNIHREEPRCVVVRLREEASACSLDLPQTILTLDKVFTFEWATDTVLFYTTQEGLRCSRVFRLDLTSNGSRITPVYEDTQADTFVEVALSRDKHMLTINCNSKTSSEVWFIDVTMPSLQPILVQPRQPDLLYHVEHWRGWLVILANTSPGQEYQVLKAPLSEPSMMSWVPLYVPDPGSAVRDLEVAGDHCVLTTRVTTGELVLTVVPLAQPKQTYSIQLPSWACTAATKRPDVANIHRVLEFLLSSPVHPPVPYHLYPKDGFLLLGTEEEGTPPEDLSGSKYFTTRLEAHGQDDTLVPVTLFHAVPVACLREAPLLVHVYGSYGRDLNMDFCPERRLLLEQGWALAYCHIRGGGERGLSWHKQARMGGKQKGVADLLACLYYLFSLGVSSPLLTALTACSAGAVPVGALCNTHPHLMRAVTLQAPFLDVLGTMEDPGLPLTVEEREEWGDPLADPQHRLNITSYCPLHNITPQLYPSVLLTAYRGDARVPLSGIVKYTEKLNKAIQTHFSTHPGSECEPRPNVVLNIQPGADHFGPEDFGLMLEEMALQLAFLYTELGLQPPRHPRKRKR
ncbi:prolyl endopeptidase-like [Lampris incognitus]|uniref:prolyl endopeptidase-like n=1 Tax=Lampris incognitus TaxID=2546036 RepID=UPI0024B4DAE3|nr:prolyl endopeptidase-like [Lampris incognitus]